MYYIERSCMKQLNKLIFQCGRPLQNVANSILTETINFSYTSMPELSNSDQYHDVIV